MLTLALLLAPISLLVLVYLWEDFQRELDALLIDDLGRIDYN